MVIMCSARSLLIRSTNAASVVDLPWPTGPTTKKNPCSRRVKTSRIGGKFNSTRFLISPGIRRNATPTTPCCKKALPRNLVPPFVVYEKSTLLFFSKRANFSLVSRTDKRPSVSLEESFSLFTKGTSTPATRMLGKLPALICKSEPPSRETISTSSSNSFFSSNIKKYCWVPLNLFCREQFCHLLYHLAWCPARLNNIAVYPHAFRFFYFLGLPKIGKKNDKCTGNQTFFFYFFKKFKTVHRGHHNIKQ